MELQRAGLVSQRRLPRAATGARGGKAERGLQIGEGALGGRGQVHASTIGLPASVLLATPLAANQVQVARGSSHEPFTTGHITSHVLASVPSPHPSSSAAYTPAAGWAPQAPRLRPRDTRGTQHGLSGTQRPVRWWSGPRTHAALQASQPGHARAWLHPPCPHQREGAPPSLCVSQHSPQESPGTVPGTHAQSYPSQGACRAAAPPTGPAVDKRQEEAGW